jgi:hypothetical protein
MDKTDAAVPEAFMVNILGLPPIPWLAWAGQPHAPGTGVCLALYLNHANKDRARLSRRKVYTEHEYVLIMVLDPCSINNI